MVYADYQVTDITTLRQNQRALHQQPTDVSRQFFSNSNIDSIQRAIQLNVYKQSSHRHKIARQDDAQLQLIMQSLYARFASNGDTNPGNELSFMNNKVVEECTRIILPRVEQYVGYLRDAARDLPVLPYGENTSTAGSRVTQLDRTL